jgi:ATP-dependent Lon protease
MWSSSCWAGTGAGTDPTEIEEGVEMVREQLTARTVRADKEELFKA